jgi:hypothetical protein
MSDAEALALEPSFREVPSAALLGASAFAAWSIFG